MVRTTGVLNMIMMSFISIPLVTVAWLLIGYSLAFSGRIGRRTGRRFDPRRDAGDRRTPFTGLFGTPLRHFSN